MRAANVVISDLDWCMARPLRKLARRSAKAL
jgi:hypothetical protein